jgi:signal transduction histidine kinase
VTACSGTPLFFNYNDWVDATHRLHPVGQALFQIAERARQGGEQLDLIRRVSLVLPDLANAPNDAAFYRAVCELMTAPTGLGFHRAAFFLFDPGKPLAHCVMALDRPPTPAARGNPAETELGEPSLGLAALIAQAFATPVPADDRLYEEIASGEGKVVSLVSDRVVLKALTTPSGEARAVRLDPGGVPWFDSFTGRSGDKAFPRQAFLFPVSSGLPSALEGHRVIGFVIADRIYDNRDHDPDAGDPDLEMTALILRHVAHFCRLAHRNRFETELLRAAPILHHAGRDIRPSLNCVQRTLDGAGINDGDCALAVARLERIAGLIERLSSMRDAVNADANLYFDLGEYVSGGLSAAVNSMYGDHVELLVGDVAPATISAPKRPVEDILITLFDNALSEARRVGREKCRVQLASRLLEVPIGANNVRPYALITLANDGPPIAPELADLLFVSGMSTKESSEGHGGVGLALARLSAQSLRGDLFLVSPGRPMNLEASDWVTFGLLVPSTRPPAGGRGRADSIHQEGR